MEFDKSKVYSAANADEVKIGSVGYFADSLGSLKELVANDSSNKHVLTAVYSENAVYRFSYGDLQWGVFYLISESEEKICTNGELSRWLAEGRGELLHTYARKVTTHFTYNIDETDKPVESGHLVKKWGDKDWSRPTKEYIL